MMYQINRERWPLRKAPSSTAERDADPVDSQDRIVKIGQTIAESGEPWWHVEVLHSGQPPRRGFIPDDRLEEIPADELQWPKEIDRVRFISVLTTAARQYGTNRDYLALVAQMESGIQNIPSSENPEAIGPFRFSPAKWKVLVEFDEKLDSPSGVTVDDIGTPWLQPLMAVLLTAQNAEALLNARGQAPTGIELYLAHIFGLEVAQAMLTAQEEGGTQTIDAVLRASLGVAEANKLLQDPQRPLMSNGSPLTVGAVIKALEQRMREASDKVAADIAQLPDDLKFPQSVPSGEVSGSATNVRDVQNSSSITEVQLTELLTKLKNGSNLQQNAAQIYASAQKWRINPVFSLAQSAFETDWWTSDAFRGLNNVGGLSKAGHHYAPSGTPGRSENNDRRWETFNTPGDSFNAKMWLLRTKYIDEGLTTIRAIVAKYAPATENDVGAYVVAVERIMSNMLGVLG